MTEKKVPYIAGHRHEIVFDCLPLPLNMEPGSAVYPVPMLKACIWELVHDYWDSYWEAGCSLGLTAWTPDETGPLQWRWKICPGCGMPIVQKYPSEKEQQI